MAINIQSYIDAKGVRCPFCGSDDLQTDRPECLDCGIITQGVTCGNCGQCWNDVYSLTGVEQSG